MLSDDGSGRKETTEVNNFYSWEGRSDNVRRQIGDDADHGADMLMRMLMMMLTMAVVAMRMVLAGVVMMTSRRR